MSVEENKSLGRRTSTTCGLAATKGLSTATLPPTICSTILGRGGVRGTDGLRRYYGRFRSGFPDVRFTVDRQVAEGDKVVARWSVDAIQTGPFLGLPATGKSVHVTGINIFRIVDGRIVEGWHNLDVIGMLEQPGIAPSQ